MKMPLFIAIGLVLMVVAMLYFGQGNLIYYPQRYASQSKVLEKVDQVFYLSGGAKQWAYLPKRNSDVPPERVWWLFGGNGSVAWNWVDLLEQVDPKINQAFVLFDYPGYGFNRGSPSPKSIFQAVEDAIPAVAKQLNLKPEDLTNRSRAVGHSLGAAVALDMANRHSLSRVVAISPFTTMQDMAKRQMGSWMAALLSHRYDNEKSIDGLLKKSDPVLITIFHGEEDTLIPFEMGKTLSTLGTKETPIRFIPVPGAGHNDIVSVIETQLLAIFESGDS